jgi:hypothetical protein
MSKVIDSLFNHHADHRPVMFWELDGVMVLVLVVLAGYFLLEHWQFITLQRRNKLVLWTIFVYGIYILVLLLTLGSLVLWEHYATS